MFKVSKFFVMFIALMFAVGIVYAADTNVPLKEIVEGKENEVREELVTVLGEKVKELGIINNDILFMGNDLDNQATVKGDILGIGSNLYSNGEVEGNIRAVFFNNVQINKNVVRNVTIIGADIVLNKDVTVAGDFMALGKNIEINGTVNKNLDLAGVDVKISGVVNGNVKLTECSSVEILPGAVIKGDVNYTTYSEPMISKEAKIGGKVSGNIIVRKQTEEMNITMKIFAMLSYIALAAIVVLLAPKFVIAVEENIVKRMGMSALVGAASLVIVPVFVVLLLISMIGILPAVALGFFYICILIVDKIAVALFIAKKFVKNVNIYLGVIMGIVLLDLLMLIPILSIFVNIALFFIGTGAILLTLNDMRKGKNEKAISE